MNSDQIASLVEIGLPFLIGVLLLARPSWFVKNRLGDARYLNAKKRLAKGGVLLLIAAGLIFVAHAGELFSPKKMSPEEFLATVVEQNNRILPRPIDEFTTLERVSASGNTFLFHYTLQNLDIGGLSAEAAAEALKPALIKQLGSLRSVEELRAHGIHIHHVYATADGSRTFTIKIAPTEY